MAERPDQPVENVLVIWGYEQRIGLDLLDFPVTVEQHRHIGLQAGRAEELQNGFRSNLERTAKEFGDRFRQECEGSRDALDRVAVIHGEAFSVGLQLHQDGCHSLQMKNRV